MTTIAQVKGLWYVVKSSVNLGMMAWIPVSVGYSTSDQARAKQYDVVYGRV